MVFVYNSYSGRMSNGGQFRRLWVEIQEAVRTVIKKINTKNSGLPKLLRWSHAHCMDQLKPWKSHLVFRSYLLRHLSNIWHDPLIIIINRVVFCLLLDFPGKLKTRNMSWNFWDVFLLICEERWSRRCHPRILDIMVGKLEIGRKFFLVGIWWNERGSLFIVGMLYIEVAWVVKLVRVGLKLC